MNEVINEINQDLYEDARVLAALAKVAAYFNQLIAEKNEPIAEDNES